jgi:hypothetical protein
MVKHSEYFDMDWKRIRKLVRNPIIVDGRNMDLNHLKQDYEVFCVGKSYIDQ